MFDHAGNPFHQPDQPTVRGATQAARRRSELAAKPALTIRVGSTAVEAAAMTACDTGNDDDALDGLLKITEDQLIHESEGRLVELERELLLSSGEISACESAEQSAQVVIKQEKVTQPAGPEKSNWSWPAVFKTSVYLTGAVAVSVATLMVGTTFLDNNAEGGSFAEQATMIAFLVFTPVGISAFHFALKPMNRDRFYKALHIVTWPLVLAFIVLLVMSTSGMTVNAAAPGGGGYLGGGGDVADVSDSPLQMARKIVQLIADLLTAAILELSALRLIVEHCPQRWREPERRKAARKAAMRAIRIRRILEPAHVDLEAARASIDGWMSASLKATDNAFRRRVFEIRNIRDRRDRSGGLFGHEFE